MRWREFSEAIHQVILRREEQQQRRSYSTQVLQCAKHLQLIGIQSPYTHGFVVEFGSEDDRDYYVSKDPAHQDFIKFAGELLQNVKVLDYEPGKL